MKVRLSLPSQLPFPASRLGRVTLPSTFIPNVAPDLVSVEGL